MAKNIPKFFECNGAKIPTVGLGTHAMTCDVAELVYNSIKNGIRLIDTALNYGTEEGIGKGINKAIEEGIVKREDLFIITKGNDEWTDPEDEIKKSLKLLQLDYVDLYLEHWPKFLKYTEKHEIINKLPMHVVWPIMESFVEKGYTKYIGVSNYNVQSLLNVLSFCKIKP